MYFVFSVSNNTSIVCVCVRDGAMARCFWFHKIRSRHHWLEIANTNAVATAAVAATIAKQKTWITGFSIFCFDKTRSYKWWADNLIVKRLIIMHKNPTFAFAVCFVNLFSLRTVFTTSTRGPKEFPHGFTFTFRRTEKCCRFWRIFSEFFFVFPTNAEIFRSKLTSWMTCFAVMGLYAVHSVDTMSKAK